MSRALIEALLDEEPGPLSELPGRTVQVHGTTVVLYGIAHGQRRFVRPGAALKRLVRAVAALDTPPDVVVRLERGMSSVFGTDEHLELPVRAGDLFDGFPLKEVLSVLLLLPLLPFAGLALRLNRDPFTRLTGRALHDPRWLPALHEAIRLREAPEPLGMSMLRAGGRGWVVRHSELMAEAVRGATDHAREVHVIVGLAHLAHLEYLLANGPGGMLGV